MLSDIEIAQKATMKKIQEVAASIGIPEDELEPYGRYKAKVSLGFVDSLKAKKNGKLILVTAISPTPAGEGKTTTTVGVGDALNHIGKKAIICLREPSLGPVFGMKGGAAGGGYAQVVPMEDINLHFTGDFSAIALANNLLAALLDNHINHGNELGFDVRRIVWKRVVDMNDRALRDITIALGGPANGYPRQDGFDIVVASEIMAIFCLATSIKDLKERIGKITMEIANLGRGGLKINEPEARYHLENMEGDFSGLHLLCLMHVGFQMFDPEADAGTGLDREYEAAVSMRGGKA